MANNKKVKYPEFCMGYVNDETWYVGSDGAQVLPTWSVVPKFNTSFAYLFWLANNKKGKYLELCMGHSDETWYVSCGRHNITHQVL